MLGDQITEIYFLNTSNYHTDAKSCSNCIFLLIPRERFTFTDKVEVITVSEGCSRRDIRHIITRDHYVTNKQIFHVRLMPQLKREQRIHFTQMRTYRNLLFQIQSCRFLHLNYLFLCILFHKIVLTFHCLNKLF